MGFKIVDKTIKFVESVEGANDRSLAKMSSDIERLAKQTVPHDKGPLQTSGRHERMGKNWYRVIFNKEYAEYQERGMRADGTHVVKHYSKPGKGPHYLENAGRKISAKINEYLRNEGSVIRL